MAATVSESSSVGGGPSHCSPLAGPFHRGRNGGRERAVTSPGPHSRSGELTCRPGGVASVPRRPLAQKGDPHRALRFQGCAEDDTTPPGKQCVAGPGQSLRETRLVLPLWSALLPWAPAAWADAVRLERGALLHHRDF